MTAHAPLRLVLDTNVVIDWLVFDDPYLAVFRERVMQGRVLVMTNALATSELARVLDYPALRLSEARKRAVLARYEAQTTLAVMPQGFAADALQLPEKFPHCRDRDDDAFLALALHSRATGLVTRDKALLKLRKRTRKFGLPILEVPQMVAMLGA
jgi:putative PIN family toxin of toxin-antitoxin system